jgi:beta-phosphoglucomutase-like phosphatase (HAD superfamily)
VTSLLDTRSALAAIVCDAVGTLVSPAGLLVADDGVAALDRARAAGLRVAVVHDASPAGGGRLPDALTRVDLVAVPRGADRTNGRQGEVRPGFVRRTCRRLGVEPAACVVVGARRPLLAAAAWAGARTVMVPNDDTPLFDVRGQRHVAPDLATAVVDLLAEAGVR